MSGFRTPEIPREQMVLWERRLEDALPEDHQVRHLEVLLGSAAFAGTFREMEQRYVLNRGQPPYPPRDLAALYWYGMLHRLRSSRRLEDACHARLDVIWLMQGQTPDHSTLADFVGRHGAALRKLFRGTLRVLIEAGLVKLSQVAIDGSKVEADAGKNSVRGEEKIRSWQGHVDEEIAALEQEWAENEKRRACLFGESNPGTSAPGKGVKNALGRLKRKQEKLARALAQLERRQEAHVGSKPPKRIASTTDPDARSMKGAASRTTTPRWRWMMRVVRSSPRTSTMSRTICLRRTQEGCAICKRRKYTVEPRIGHLKHNLGVRRFLRRGIEKVKTEWIMACTAVNLGILLRHWDDVATTL